MANSPENSNNQKGRGWHGNSEGHKRAGRLGGLARSKRNKETDSTQNNEE